MSKMNKNNAIATIKTGESCPYCASDTIESTDVPQIDGNYIFLGMVCCECSGEWREAYKMYRVYNIKTGQFLNNERGCAITHNLT